MGERLKRGKKEKNFILFNPLRSPNSPVTLPSRVPCWATQQGALLGYPAGCPVGLNNNIKVRGVPHLNIFY
jgi:hypothetical protein